MSERGRGDVRGLARSVRREPETVNEASEAAKVGAKLDMIRQGKPLAEIDPALEKDVRFHVLALAPNAARLSIRFYLEDTFGAIAANYRRYLDDMAIDPPPRDAQPALWKYLAETAVLGKRENVPPNLAGEWLRSILAGTRYPQTLLATILMRLRADGDVSALRVSMLKAVLIRNFNKEAPVALDPDNRDKGYLLGRLFAVYEHVQSAALGPKVNATVKDKFYASASAQPRKVFALLEHGSANHLVQGRQGVAGPQDQSGEAGRRDHGPDGPGRGPVSRRAQRRAASSVRPWLLSPAQRFLPPKSPGRRPSQRTTPNDRARQPLRFRAAVRSDPRQSQRRSRRRQSAASRSRDQSRPRHRRQPEAQDPQLCRDSPMRAKTATTSMFRKARSSTTSTARPTRPCARDDAKLDKEAKLNPKDDAEAGK